MTAHDYINAMIWPGHLGLLLACTAKVTGRPEHLPDDVLRYAAERHRAAADWDTQPWLEITVRLDRRHHSFPPRSIAIAVPVSAELEPLAATVHRVALYVMESELLESARLAGRDGIEGRVWRTEIYAPMREMPSDAAWQVPT